ncbi:MAG TPA: 50S ribosomal protein L24 [Nitrososphaeraceae archaeon]
MKNRILGSNLTQSLRDQYSKRSLRVIKGDTIKVLRGEYSGIEGKVERVNTKRATLSIEGVQREKIRGGNVKVPIHSSNVQIVSLKLDDPYRERMLGPDRKVNVKGQKKKAVRNSETRINNSTKRNKKVSRVSSRPKRKTIGSKRRTTD